MNNISLERKVMIYEAVLRKLNVYGNLMIDHTKMRELMVAIMEWQHSLKDGEYTQEEQQGNINRTLDRLTNLVGL